MAKTKSIKDISRVLSAEVLICEFLLALGLQEMLNGFKFNELFRVQSFTELLSKVPSLLILFSIMILAVWVAQLLASWKEIYQTIDVNELPLGGLVHLWFYVPYVGLIYLACRYQQEYPLPLYFIILVVLLDIVSSLFDMKSANKLVKETNKKWLIRDIFLFVPFLGLEWYLNLLDHQNAIFPSLRIGLTFFVCMLFGYLYDLVVNREFYNTQPLWYAIWNPKQGPPKG